MAGKANERLMWVSLALGKARSRFGLGVKPRPFKQGVERELNIRLKTAFESEGIEIPFPKRDINLVIQSNQPKVTY